MGRRQYILDNVKVDALAYYKEDRVVKRNGLKGKYCFISLPLWMEGEVFDIVLIPKSSEQKHDGSPDGSDRDPLLTRSDVSVEDNEQERMTDEAETRPEDAL